MWGNQQCGDLSMCGRGWLTGNAGWDQKLEPSKQERASVLWPVESYWHVLSESILSLQSMSHAWVDDGCSRFTELVPPWISCMEWDEREAGYEESTATGQERSRVAVIEKRGGDINISDISENIIFKKVTKETEERPKHHANFIMQCGTVCLYAPISVKKWEYTYKL